MTMRLLAAGIFLAMASPGPVLAQNGSQTDGTQPEDPEFTDEFPIEDCDFVIEGNNRYFILDSGRQSYFSNVRCVQGGECEELAEVVITVLDETKQITLNLDGEQRQVTTRVVEERESIDSELAEVSRNYFAECKATGDVYYFGEDVDIYEGGQVVAHDGSWRAGQDEARPGIIMPGGAFLLGARYFQEVAPGVALDRAEHVDMGLDIEAPAGMFSECVEVEETTPLAPDEVSTKVYCPDTGLVVDDDVELVTAPVTPEL